MKTSLPAVSLFLLGGFALLGSGCVTEYSTVSSAPPYSGTTLPAASRVAVVMVFQGGDPSPDVREDVRLLIGDYLAEKGSVLVADPADADYLVHVVLERRNPANPDEWTVVNIYSAQSLGVGGGDYYAWPGGMIEDETYGVTTFAYVGFGMFYPVWFDLWDSPWHRRHLVVMPPPRSHSHYREPKWRDDRRRHNPGRWHGHDRRDDHRPPVVTRPPSRPDRDGPKKIDPKRDDHGKHDTQRPPVVNRPSDRRPGDQPANNDRRRRNPQPNEGNRANTPPKVDQHRDGNDSSFVGPRPPVSPQRPEPKRDVTSPEPPRRVVIPGHPNHPVTVPAKDVARPAGRRVDGPTVQPLPQPRDSKVIRHDTASPRTHSPEPQRSIPEVRRTEPRNVPTPQRSELRREEHRDRNPQPAPTPEKKTDSDRDKDDPRR